jgi:hypothetical protein
METDIEDVETRGNVEILDSGEKRNDEEIPEIPGRSRETDGTPWPSGCPLPHKHDEDCSNCNKHSHVPIRKPKQGNLREAPDRGLREL